MKDRSHIRRCALQALYQFDAHRGDFDDDFHADVQRSLEESIGDPGVHRAGFELAQRVWAQRQIADSAVAERSPDWPTHRQPVIDRCLLRLAWFELTEGKTPPAVIINEAIELAREFSTDRSPEFVNAILDRILKDGAAAPAETDTPA